MSKKKVPFIAVGNDELEGSIHKGDLIDCPANCGDKHEIRLGISEGKENNTLQFVTCPKSKKSYLVGIRNKQFKPGKR